jgi:hypothetical protein
VCPIGIRRREMPDKYDIFAELIVGHGYASGPDVTRVAKLLRDADKQSPPPSGQADIKLNGWCNHGNPGDGTCPICAQERNAQPPQPSGQGEAQGKLIEGLSIIMSCIAGVNFIDANSSKKYEHAKEAFREEAIEKIKPYADAFRTQGRRDAAEAAAESIKRGIVSGDIDVIRHGWMDDTLKDILGDTASGKDKA